MPVNAKKWKKLLYIKQRKNGAASRSGKKHSRQSQKHSFLKWRTAVIFILFHKYIWSGHRDKRSEERNEVTARKSEQGVSAALKNKARFFSGRVVLYATEPVYAKN